MRIGREDIRHKGSRTPAGPSQLEEDNDTRSISGMAQIAANMFSSLPGSGKQRI